MRGENVLKCEVKMIQNEITLHDNRKLHQNQGEMYQNKRPKYIKSCVKPSFFDVFYNCHSTLFDIALQGV